MKVRKLIPIVLICVVVCSVFVLILTLKTGNKENDSREIYATSLSISTKKDIEINLNTTLRFTVTPYTISPSNCNQKVEIKILPDSSKNNASYVNNEFKASTAGTYYLRFSVAKNSGYSYDTIKITVLKENNYDTTGISVNKYSQTINKNEIVNLNNMVEFVNTSNMLTSFRYNETSIESGMFSMSNVGNYKIDAVISCIGYEVYTNLEIKVEDKIIENYTENSNDIQSEKQIDNNFTIKDINFNEINFGQTISLSLNDKSTMFQIINNNNSHYEITIDTDNEEVASIKSIDIPLFTVKLNSIGKASITIKNLKEDEEFVFYIEVK